MSNPSNPVRLEEYAVFVALICVGFFFGSELISGVTSVFIIQLKERKVESWEDLSTNNITVVYYLISKEDWAWDKMQTLKLQHIETDNIDKESNYIRQMLYFKNVCTSTTMPAIMLGSVPERSKVHNVVYARLSNMNGGYVDPVWQMERNRPWFHWLVYNEMKFHECKLLSWPWLS